jgi:hypothetical protein
MECTSFAIRENASGQLEVTRLNVILISEN